MRSKVFLPPAIPSVDLADGALTRAVAKVCPADDLSTEKNFLFLSEPVKNKEPRNRPK